MRSVAWKPGQTKLSVTPLPRRSAAAVFAQAHNPVRAVLDRASVGEACTIVEEAMQQILPHPAALKCGRDAAHEADARQQVRLHGGQDGLVVDLKRARGRWPAGVRPR